MKTSRLVVNRLIVWGTCVGNINYQRNVFIKNISQSILMIGAKIFLTAVTHACLISTKGMKTTSGHWGAFKRMLGP